MFTHFPNTRTRPLPQGPATHVKRLRPIRRGLPPLGQTHVVPVARPPMQPTTVTPVDVLPPDPPVAPPADGLPDGGRTGMQALPMRFLPFGHVPAVDVVHE